MSSSQTKKSLTPQEEENRRQRLMAGQMEDFDPQPIEKSRTADEEKSSYVEGKKQLEGVKAWGSHAPMTEGLADKRSTKEQQRLKTTMAIEDEASNPKRIEIISTTDFHVTPPYVYWKTVRLRYIDEVDKEGTPPEKVDAVMVWRRKSTIFFNENACAHDSSAAAVAAGNAGSADAFDLGLERLAYHSTITTSQAFSYGSFLLGCLTALGLLYVYPYIVNLQ